jgi:hypothetical protein
MNELALETTVSQIGSFEAQEKLRRIYEAFKDPNSSYVSVMDIIRETLESNAGLRVQAVDRVADEPRALLVMLTGIPTDNDLRSLVDFLRGWPLRRGCDTDRNILAQGWPPRRPL